MSKIVKIDDVDIEVFMKEEVEELNKNHSEELSKLTAQNKELSDKYTQLLEKHNAMFEKGEEPPTKLSPDEQFAELFKNI